MAGPGGLDAPARFAVAVASGKGGVGKSTIALNLAVALRAEGLAVGLVDADVYGPDIPVMVNLKRDRSPEHWWMARAGVKRRLEPVEEYGIKILSAGFVFGEGDAVAWDASMVRHLVWQFVHEGAWGPLDYLLIDLPPGTADLQQSLAATLRVDGVVIVVTPQDVAHLDAKKAVAMFEKARLRVLGGVENMSGFRCPHCGEAVEVLPRVREDRSIWALGVERLGAIPLDPTVAHDAERGRPVTVAHPDSAAARAFRDLAGSLRARLEP